MESNCRKLVSACVQLGVQPAAVECLFSKEADIRKGELSEAPEGRREPAGSKLFGRPPPSANAERSAPRSAAAPPPPPPRGAPRRAGGRRPGSS
ncbi:unnamed protein product, partial [Bubo scandiacus]